LQIIREMRSIAGGYTSKEYMILRVDGAPVVKGIIVDTVNDALNLAADYIEDAPLAYPGRLFVDS